MVSASLFNLHITFETAKGKRDCRGYQNGCMGIQRDDEHLAVYEPGRNGILMRGNYCKACAPSKIKKIEEQLNRGVASFTEVKNFVDLWV